MNSVLEESYVKQRSYAWLVSSLLFFLASMLMIFFAVPSLGKPYIMDEMEYPSVAQAILETGKPVYYRGELTPENIGFWHPPLYIAWYAFWFNIFGSSVQSARFFGAFNAIILFFIMFVFTLRRWEFQRNSSPFFVWPLALFLAIVAAATSPLFVQGSTLPDIDTQVLPLVLVGFLLFVFEMRRTRHFDWVYLVFLVFGVVIQIYAKISTLLLLIPTLIVFEIMNVIGEKRLFNFRFRRLKRMNGHLFAFLFLVNSGWYSVLLRVLWVIVAIFVSFTLFVASWFVIANIWGVDYRNPFFYLSYSSNNPLNFAGSSGLGSVVFTIISDMRSHFSYAVTWIGIPVLLFVFIVTVIELRNSQKGLFCRSERFALLVFFTSLLLLYLILRPAPFVFPKYWPPLIPVISLLIADFLMSFDNRRRFFVVLLLLFVGTIVYQVYIQINPVTSGRDFILTLYTEWPKEPLVYQWQILPLIVALIVSVIVALFMKDDILGFLAVGALVVVLGWQINVVTHQMRVSYSTTYMYGEQSIDDVTDYLRRSLPDGAIVIAPKDVGYRLQDRWRYIELYADPRPYLDRPGVQVLVMRTNDYYGNTIRDTPEIASEVASRFDLDATIGSFSVFLRKP